LSTEISIGECDGKVILNIFDVEKEIRTEAVIDAENARQIAEGLARASYKAHYGYEPINGGSIISRQMHTDAVNRMVILLNNYDRNPNRRKEWWASEMVAAIRNILG